MKDNIIDRLEARSKELISKANDVIEAREMLAAINDKLDIIPRLDDIIAAWDNYTHLMAGEWQRFGNSLLDGRFVESPELHKEGILLLSECRDLLLPYQELLSDINLDYCLIRDKLNDFFIGHRDIDNYLDILGAFFDEFDSAKYEIEALSCETAKNDNSSLEVLPFELNTEEVKKYFPRAEKAGYMDGHNWKKSQAQLGYFCSKVFSSPRPITALEGFFGEKNLAASITQAGYAPKRNDVKKWRDAMDKAIFYD